MQADVPPRRPAKKSKMHQCEICQKWFPRPSGLATHMNSHSGAKPFPCPVTKCNKTFAVRSNCKRHLRTHGIIPQPSSSASSTPTSRKFNVDFDKPVISNVHEPAFKIPEKLRWVPHSLSTRSNVDYLESPSPSGSEDGDGDGPLSPCPTLPIPLPPVVRSAGVSDDEDGYEERDSYSDAGSHPYHPTQVSHVRCFRVSCPYSCSFV
ncbi:hypothetical protein PLICRDRAFT_112314 [Plicaturopsis crispa FD-325 SS-3]|nr:hypothetical protein PLICRDRAFT_112314 [Plicaturopsis crispa FD-325 SS-3]